LFLSDFAGHFTPLAELGKLTRIPSKMILRITPPSTSAPTTPKLPSSGSASSSSPTDINPTHGVINFEIPYEELEFGKVLGQGSFGEVRAGYWRGTEVAIKANIIQDDKDRQEFIREAKLMVNLRPHVRTSASLLLAH